MKWFTVEEKIPRENFDYLVLKETGDMSVSRGNITEEGFEWDTSGFVAVYRKLPNRPKGFSNTKLKKEAKESGRYCSFYDIFPGFKEYMGKEHGK